jgi:hypothetical protein
LRLPTSRGKRGGRVRLRSNGGAVIKTHLDLVNACFLTKRSELITDLILTTQVDVLAITESWLTINHGDTDLKAMFPIGYSAIHSLRVINKSGKRRGGGLVVLFRESIKYQRLSELLKLLSFEYLDVQFSIRSQHIRLIVIYRPPDSSFPTFVDEFALLLEGISSTRRKLIILGDFNLHIDFSCNVAGQRFLALIESFGMVQRVSGATHKRGHKLDLIITRLGDDMVSNIVVGDLHQ